MKKTCILVILLLLFCNALWSQAYWHNVVSGTSKDLLSVSFGSATTGYIGGKDSILLKTIDGGQSWQALPLSGMFSNTRRDIVDVHFISASIGYIVVGIYPQSYNSRVYKTTDGGSSWTWLLTGDAVPLHSFFFEEGEGFVLGSTFYKGYAIDKVQNDILPAGSVFSADPYLFFRAASFRSRQTGLITGDKGLLARTFNAGASWDTLRIPADTTVHAICFLDDSTILAATHNAGSTLWISHDTGRSWAIENNTLTFDYPVMYAIAHSEKDSFIAVGASTTSPGKGTIYWHDHIFNRFANTDRPLYAVALRDDSAAFAVGEQGLIVTNATPTVSVNEPENLLAMVKIYPNPSSDYCIIASPAPYTLKIYDLKGRLVFCNNTPLKEQLIQLKGKTAGVYLLQLETEQGMLHATLIVK